MLDMNQIRNLNDDDLRDLVKHLYYSGIVDGTMDSTLIDTAEPFYKDEMKNHDLKENIRKFISSVREGEK